MSEEAIRRARERAEVDTAEEALRELLEALRDPGGVSARGLVDAAIPPGLSVHEGSVAKSYRLCVAEERAEALLRLIAERADVAADRAASLIAGTAEETAEESAAILASRRNAVESLTAFLHDVLRDEVPFGAIERILRDHEKHPGPYAYEAGAPVEYVRALARRILAVRAI